MSPGWHFWRANFVFVVVLGWVWPPRWTSETCCFRRLMALMQDQTNWASEPQWLMLMSSLLHHLSRRAVTTAQRILPSHTVYSRPVVKRRSWASLSWRRRFSLHKVGQAFTPRPRRCWERWEEKNNILGVKGLWQRQSLGHLSLLSYTGSLLYWWLFYSGTVWIRDSYWLSGQRA